MEIRRGTASLILGILGLTFLPAIGSIAAIWIGRKSSPDDGLAKAGVVLGWVGLALSLMGCCVGAVAGLLPAFSEGFSGYAPDPQPVQPVPPASREQPAPAQSDPVQPAPSGRGYLGIRCEDAGGAKVAEVYDDSPAAHAGLQVGDVITLVDRQYIAFCADLAREIASRPGQRVSLSVLRDGKTIEVQVTLGAR